MLLQAMSMGPEIAPSVSMGPLGPASGAQGFAMGLAVPGLTVPWGHAGYLWLATAASIAVHEVHTLQHLVCCITAFPNCALVVPAQPATANAVPCDSLFTFSIDSTLSACHYRPHLLQVGVWSMTWMLETTSAVA